MLLDIFEDKITCVFNKKTLNIICYHLVLEQITMVCFINMVVIVILNNIVIIFAINTMFKEETLTRPLTVTPDHLLNSEEVLPRLLRVSPD